MANGTFALSTSGTHGDNVNVWAEWSAVKSDILNSSVFSINVYIQRKSGKLLPTSITVLGPSVSEIRLGSLITVMLESYTMQYVQSSLGGSYHKIYDTQVLFSTSKAFSVDVYTDRPSLVCSGTYTFPHNADGTYNLRDVKIVLSLEDSLLSSLAISKLNTGSLVFDACDVAYPLISGLSVAPSQLSALISFSVDCATDLRQYSFDGGSTWINLPQDNNLTGLTDYTLYNLKIRIRKTVNQKHTEISVQFRTLPYKITSFDFPQAVDVDEGSTLPLSLNIQPLNASVPEVFFTSSDNNIATADSYQFFGHQKGTCSITAQTTSPNDIISHICTVNVIRRVKGISVVNQQVTVNQSASSQILWSLYPQGANNTNVSFTSNDDSIASVSTTGLISGISAGSCTITATTEDGGYIANIEVTVVDGITSWQNITPAGQTLNYTDFVRIYENQIYLREKLVSTGEVLAALTPINDPAAINASINTEYIKMRDIFEAIESNIDTLNSGSYVSAFYIAPHTIGLKEPNRAEYDRLINILLDIKNHIERNQLITNGADVEFEIPEV